MGKHTVVPIPIPVEDSHAALLDGLADGPHYDVVQLDPADDPDFVGLLVDGQLRATYRKVDVYQANSLVARTILDRAADKAWAANYQVRNFNRALRGANGLRQEVPADLGEKPADWKAEEFVTPPLSDGTTSAREVPIEAGGLDEDTSPKFDMGPTKKFGFDEEPPFLEHVIGIATPQDPTTEEGWE